MSFKQPLKAGSIIATLDVGSSKIACFIAQMIDDEGGYEIVGVGHQASLGIKNGVIVDISQAKESDNPNFVLESAMDNYECLVVIGYNKDGFLEARGSTNMKQVELNWMLDQFKHSLLVGEFEGEVE